MLLKRRHQFDLFGEFLRNIRRCGLNHHFSDYRRSCASGSSQRSILGTMRRHRVSSLPQYSPSSTSQFIPAADKFAPAFACAFFHGTRVCQDGFNQFMTGGCVSFPSAPITGDFLMLLADNMQRGRGRFYIAGYLLCRQVRIRSFILSAALPPEGEHQDLSGQRLLTAQQPACPRHQHRCFYRFRLPPVPARKAH